MNRLAPLALLCSAMTMTHLHTAHAAPPSTDVGKAPPAPEWQPIDKPIINGELTCLTKRTATVVHGRLIYLDLYPPLCQTSMDAQADVLRQRCDGQRTVDAASASSTCDAKVEATKAASWSTFDVLGAVAGGIIAGFIAGKLLK